VRGLRIPDRVRLRNDAALGTVFANPYEFGGKVKAGVIWDAAPKWLASVEVSRLVRAESETACVPVEARPYSVGALASPERRF
jgi:hypothetical protein